MPFVKNTNNKVHCQIINLEILIAPLTKVGACFMEEAAAATIQGLD